MPRETFRNIVLLCFCILFASFTAAAPEGVADKPPQEYLDALKYSNAHYTPYCNRPDQTEDLDCTSETSGDFYGTGVRLGVYFAWVASWIANLCNPDEIAGALDANAIFLISLMVSLVYQTSQRKLAYIDALILMQIAAGYMFGCFSVWGYRTAHYFEEGRKGDVDTNQM